MKHLYTILIATILPTFLFTTNPPEKTLTLTVAVEKINCFGQKSFALAMASGGEGMISYNWSNGETTQVAQDLLPGAYSVTVSDEAGNKTTENIEVSSPEELVVDISWENIKNPGGKSGEVLVTPFGGTPPYQYSWSNGEQEPLLFDLDAGEYAVTISDKNGCEFIESISIFEPELKTDSEITDIGKVDDIDSKLIETPENKLKLFPKPANSNLLLTFPNNPKQQYRNLQIQVLDNQGKIVFKQDAFWQNNQLQTFINVSQFPIGTYYLNVLKQGQIWKTKKFVVES